METFTSTSSDEDEMQTPIKFNPFRNKSATITEREQQELYIAFTMLQDQEGKIDLKDIYRNME